MQSNILVTGGAGFIGSHAVDRLLEEGCNVVCIDNFDDYYDPRIKHRNLFRAMTRPSFQLIEGDIRDERALNAGFDRYPIDTVLHLASRAGVRSSLTAPELYYDVNVTGTLRVLEAMRRHGVSRMVFGSSSSVYGDSRKIPLSEADMVDRPISPYAATKKAAELICHTYHHLYGFDIFCLRLFTVYGPRQRPEMAIHRFVESILAGEPITLYGDGSSRRDYTYVADILDGLFGALSNLKGYEIINIGESRSITLTGLIDAIEDVLEQKADIRWLPMQPGDVTSTCADITKAKNLLHYNPRYTIPQGLAEFKQWYFEVEHVPGYGHHAAG